MKLPPYAELLGLSIEPGAEAPVLVMPFADAVLGRPGFVHGGALGGLMEMAAVGALRQALGDDAVRIKPINLSVDYMRGGRNKPTRARGHVSRLGNRIANIEVLAWQDDEARPIAAGRINYLIVR